MCVCIHVHMRVHSLHCLEIRRQLLGINSLLILQEFWGSNSGWRVSGVAAIAFAAKPLCHFQPLPLPQSAGIKDMSHHTQFLGSWGHKQHSVCSSPSTSAN